MHASSCMLGQPSSYHLLPAGIMPNRASRVGVEQGKREPGMEGKAFLARFEGVSVEKRLGTSGHPEAVDQAVS